MLLIQLQQTELMITLYFHISSLDISGNVDIDGTVDALTINGTDEAADHSKLISC